MRNWITLLGLSLVTLGSAQSEWIRYRVTAPTPAAAQRLSDSSLALFSDDVVVGDTDVIVGPGEAWKLISLGLPFRWISALPDPRNWSATHLGTEADDYQHQYLRYDAIIAQYETWRAQNPDLVTRQAIGTSWNGRTIWAYRFFGSANGNRIVKHSVVVEAGVHAREWISPAVGMYLFDKLINSFWTRNILTARMPAGTAFYFIPVINPDGYEYCWTNDRFWRKNRRNNGSSFGVDLNRNFSKGWGGPGSSGSSNSETYRGPSAFSEPETQALRDFMDTIPPVKAFLDLHSYGQLVLWAWGYTENLAPGDPWLRATGNAMKQGIFANGGKSYTAGPCSTTLYLASGVSPDYAYDRYNAAAYTIELRDTGQFGFVLPEDQILPTQIEAWGGFQELVARMLMR